MWDYLILLIVGSAGLWGGRWWLILIGTIGLCFDGFLQKWEMLKARPLVPLDLKIAAFFLGGLGSALAVSAACYLIGSVLGMLSLVGS